MLMPSALSSCGLSHPPVTRLQSSLFASPPASPPTSPHTTFSTIANSCRALQSMMTTPPPMPSQLQPLPTPPMAHAPFSPIKMRLRPRPQNTSEDRSRMRIRKRTVAPPRGVHKRRRASDDDMGRDDDIDSELDISGTDVDEPEDTRLAIPAPTTPKRARIAPANLPRGLERSDFHDLHEPAEEEVKKEGTGVEEEVDGERWSLEDDRVLVELICEKLKLSKSEWQECARRVGKSENGAERRWKTLIRNGEIGVKSRARRGKVHGTWG
ncbi:hypothetical protein F5B18DRAFT_279430 [Nemania serpens]|nr:hypothetical protein F5B18DRAFT_279430 [Nemania serpens]